MMEVEVRAGRKNRRIANTFSARSLPHMNPAVARFCTSLRQCLGREGVVANWVATVEQAAASVAAASRVELVGLEAAWALGAVVETVGGELLVAVVRSVAVAVGGR